MVDITFGKKQPGEEYAIREGVYLVCVENGLAAVVSCFKGGFLPGGVIEAGESREQCLVRECIEETGMHAEVGEYLACSKTYFDSVKNGRRLCLVQHYYSGRLTRRVTDEIEPGSELIYLPLEEARRFMHHESQRWALGLV
jgi:8-oxo-dGTP diphosphatase